MRIGEITGYRGMPAYTAAQGTFTPGKDPRQGNAGLQRQKQLDSFTEFMEKNGFKALGQGYHGAVYEKPGYPYVFKVYKDDPAYETFVRWAMAHQSNPNVPRFKGKPLRIAPGTYVVRMENLEPMHGAHFDLVRVLTRLSDEWDYIKDLDGDMPREMSWLDRNHPGIAEIVSVAHNAWRDYVLDSHRDNIMLRGDTPVVVDPISG